jgi:hypothetical protein|tara:strand:+ start:966 stop:1286 length:321 start_codon:yes stop_codon:yes gene_type:complete
MSYLGFISVEKGESSKGLWEPTVVCKCGNRHEGDEPSINVKECEQCEGKMIEHEEGIVEMIDKDDMVWSSICCGGKAITELVEDGDIGIAICSECLDWSDFELEEE